MPVSTKPVDGREMSVIFGQAAIPTRPEEWVFHLPEKTASVFFGFGPNSMSDYDPWTYARPRRMKDLSMPWPEHPTGRLSSDTNSLGCRETHELSDPPCELRVLVAGDSHTYGVCNDDEVVTERMEIALRGLRPGKTIEVLNAGSGGYTFLNYLGTWFRLRAFKPQVFLVIVYAGNDFGEMLGPSLHFTNRPWPKEVPGRNERRTAMIEAAPNAMAQGLDSIESCREWPDERARGVREALYLCGEMQRVAQADGAKFVVAYLPSPFLLAWPDPSKRPGQVAIDGFGLKPADFERERAHGETFLAGLAEVGIACIDLTPVFAREPIPPYWLHDLHLSSHGHDLAARAIVPVLETLLPR